jgi:hypothetical protein
MARESHLRPMLQQLYPEMARSTLYEWKRALPLIKVIVTAGLLDEWLRDRETGRKASTILREMGRLTFTSDDDVIDVYRALRTEPIADVRSLVKMLNVQAKLSVQSLDAP